MIEHLRRTLEIVRTPVRFSRESKWKKSVRKYTQSNTLDQMWRLRYRELFCELGRQKIARKKSQKKIIEWQDCQAILSAVKRHAAFPHFFFILSILPSLLFF